jgi:TPR repeat protein
VLSAGLRTLAHLQLTTREPTNVPKAIASLRRAHGIAKSNGCLRAACDDACNLYSTCLKYGGGVPREEALTGLRKAKDQAASLGYARCHVELLLALGLGHMRTETRTWQVDETELELAETYLEKAIELVEPSSAMHVQALGHRCLCHLLRATAARELSSSSTIFVSCTYTHAQGARLGIAQQIVGLGSLRTPTLALVHARGSGDCRRPCGKLVRPEGSQARTAK